MELRQLMSRIAAGDKDAFRELYAQYDQTVFTIALAKVKDRGVAMDVVKNVFKTVYKTLRRAPYTGDFMAWLNALVDTEIGYMQRAAAMPAAASRSGAKHVTPAPAPASPYAAPQPAPPYQQPAYQPPAYGQAPVAPPPAPAYQQPVYQQPVYQQPVYQQPVYQQPVMGEQPQPGYAAPAYTPPAAARAASSHPDDDITPLTPDQVLETAYQQDVGLDDDSPFESGIYRRYTEDEARALSARADELTTEPEDEPPPPSRGFGYYFLTVLGFAGSLVLLWMLAGLLMRLNILPSYDLGYTWFNETLFPLF